MSCIATVWLLPGCSSLQTKPSPVRGPTPLQLASCPVLTPMVSATFDAYIKKLDEVATHYQICRQATLGQGPR
jgi:hypothetical protein